MELMKLPGGSPGPRDLKTSRSRDLVRGSGAVLAVGAVVVAACGGPGAVEVPPESMASGSASAGVVGPVTKPVVRKTLDEVGLSEAALDKSVDPCDDFYRFACGGWIDKTKIPGDKSRWVRSFSVIHERNEQDLKRILEQAAKAGASDPVTEKLGAFYGSCMDEKAQESAKLEPLKPWLTEIGRVRTLPQLTALITKLHQHRVWVLFDVAAEQDFKDATQMIAYLDQNGLGMPDRDYYLDLKDDTGDQKKKAEQRQTYEAHVERMLGLAGYPAWKAKQGAATVMEIETELAGISKTKVERRDPKGLYNKIDRKGLLARAPSFPWADYLKALGQPELEDINVTSVKFFEGVNALLGRVAVARWAPYLTYHLVHALSDALPKAFFAEAFKLSQSFTGQKEPRPRWKRCVAATDDALGELLAQPFVKQRFAGESKSAAEKYVSEISKAFDKNLPRLAWMDEKTRSRARGKLGTLAFLIGYPGKWKQYDFVVGKGFADNLLGAKAFELKENLSQLGQKIDRDRWEMTPPTVNAYYHPLKNQMVFPAGILQPPFYSVKASMAVNLGAMGMVVGHELTHGFDDQGAQFDQDGNLKNWWQPEVVKKFEGLTSCVSDQYSKYEIIDGVHINGKLTLGENIADMGGVKLAYQAFESLLESAPVRVEASGFSEQQQFFISTGQIWCAKATDKARELRAKTDPHSDPRYRVIGALSNTPEFAQAFSCKPGRPMAPKNACGVW